MAIIRMDNVMLVVEDLEHVKGFLTEVGMELEGAMMIDGPWASQVVGLENVRSHVAVMRTPDGHGKIELCQYDAPAAIRSEPVDAPANTLGLRRVMFAVDDVDELVARLEEKYNAELVGEIVDFSDAYRLCYLRGPEGIVLGLAQPLS